MLLPCFPPSKPTAAVKLATCIDFLVATGDSLLVAARFKSVPFSQFEFCAHALWEAAKDAAREASKGSKSAPSKPCLLMCASGFQFSGQVAHKALKFKGPDCDIPL